MVDADPAFAPKSIDNAYPSLRRLLTIDPAEFSEIFVGTPVTRAKRRGLARNAAVVLGNLGSEDDLPLLVTALRTHDEPLVRGHAAWAIGQIGAGRAKAALESRRGAEPDASVVHEIELALTGCR
jgi:epoxyqueuosine reductase